MEQIGRWRAQRRQLQLKASGRASGPARRQATRRAKMSKNPSVPASGASHYARQSSPEPLTPALSAEFTTADRNMRRCRTRSRAHLIIPCNRLVLVAVGAFWRKKYSPLISKGQYDFADVLTAFHASMGGARLDKRKGRIDQGLDAAGGKKRQRVLFHRLGDGGLIRDRARTQRRAGMGEALEHQPHEIDGHPRRSQKRDLHDAAFDGGGLVVAADVIAADHVED